MTTEPLPIDVPRESGPAAPSSDPSPVDPSAWLLTLDADETPEESGYGHGV